MHLLGFFVCFCLFVFVAVMFFYSSTVGALSKASFWHSLIFLMHYNVLPLEDRDLSFFECVKNSLIVNCEKKVSLTIYFE